MNHRDDNALIPYRMPAPCELCGRWCQQREAHHIWTRGAGQLDIPINLAGLGGAWSCSCHPMLHRGKIPRRLVVEAIGRREGLHPDFIEAQIFRLRRAPKECELCLTCLGAGTYRLAKKYGFKRYECPSCHGGGVLLPTGEPWVEPERRLAGT